MAEEETPPYAASLELIREAQARIAPYAKARGLTRMWIQKNINKIIINNVTFARVTLCAKRP